ncbi:MAG: sulfate transporter, inner rane subunit [Pseudonocardiales bacterium]|nr:sulfate transporter, inner rane subunit [Pseudonocardiales bacterium]
MASRVGRRSRNGLRVVAVLYVTALVLVPLGVITWRTVRQGGHAFWSAISSAQAVEAFRLTAIVAGSAVVINIVFGVGVALLLTRYHFPGKRVLSVLIDVPISVSPIVVGLALVLVYGPNNGWFGLPLHNAGVDIIYAVPGMILATTFVALPLVVREVVPVLEDEGFEQEQAARVLGAGAIQRFRRITLPTIKWALAYGVVLSIARSIGEFGAVKVVSGNISGSGQTQTATLLVDERVEQLEPGAYQVSLVLIAVAVIAIIVVSVIRPKENVS